MDSLIHRTCNAVVEIGMVAVFIELTSLRIRITYQGIEKKDTNPLNLPVPNHIHIP